MLKIGAGNISGLCVGEQKIKRAFVGTELVFEDNPSYTISFYGLDEDSPGTVLQSSSWVLAPGESKTLTPWEISGYVFAGWYDESGSLLSTASSFTVTATENATYYLKYYAYWTFSIAASFKNGTMVVTANGVDYSITRDANGQGHGPELHLRKNSTVTVKIKTLPGGYKFDNWLRVRANITSTADPYTFTLDRDYEILHGELSVSSRLPAGYTEVEYIAANDATSRIQSIDLRIASQSTLTFDFYLPDPSTLSGTKFIYQYYYASGSMVSQLDLILYSKALRVQSRSGGSTTYLANNIYASIPSGRYLCTYNAPSKTISCGGKSVSVTQVSGTNSPYFSVGAGTATTNNGIAGLRIYSIKATYTGTSTLAGYKTDLVPCKNPSGTVGLYDINAGKFYGPASTSHLWTAGPAV